VPRILVLSDIHANIDALEACLASAPPHDAVWNLGDIVGYGAAPNEVASCCRRLGSVFVRGNHDKVCSGVEEPLDFNPLAAQSVFWTRTALAPAHQPWLAGLRQGPLQPDASLAAQICHGSPLDEDEYLLSFLEADNVLDGTAFPLTFFGHTHVQGGFASDDMHGHSIHPEYDDGPEVSWTLRMVPGARYLINPGSVGQPRDSDPRAAYCVWHTSDNVIEYRRCSYPVLAAQQRIWRSGLPERLATRLMQGR
jgi:diadenosine tetraphosphatase ApaH/serine/threonine PP2A family protein phosphatase